MSDPVWPHRWQPTRLPHPWDSPGKNTGVGCHFLLQCMKVKIESDVTQSCPTLSDPMDWSLSAPLSMGFYRQKSTGVGCHCLLRSKSCLPIIWLFLFSLKFYLIKMSRTDLQWKEVDMHHSYLVNGWMKEHFSSDFFEPLNKNETK